jgi:hypothetical protein
MGGDAGVVDQWCPPPAAEGQEADMSANTAARVVAPAPRERD